MGNRWHWLAELIRTWDLKVGAEIGVQLGRTAVFLATQCSDLHLYAIDPWDTPGNIYITRYDWDLGKMYAHFMEQLVEQGVGDRVTVIKDFSHNAVKQFKDGELDFVFIDANHDYNECLQDLQLWFPKVRNGGFVTGHDLHFPGVVRALEEFFGSWKEAQVDYVWYIRKREHNNGKMS